MEKPTEIITLNETGGLGRYQVVGAMLAVGVAFTAAVLVMLGHFTRPDQRVVASDSPSASGNPFAGMTDHIEQAELAEPELEACQVMSAAINDINARMSEGVTEDQARYFRSRRNKLYLMMRERCGI